MSLQDFIHTIRTGHDPDGDPLFVMPWPAYQDMADRDLHAIYEYLSAIPSAPTGTNCSGAANNCGLMEAQIKRRAKNAPLFF